MRVKNRHLIKKIVAGTNQRKPIKGFETNIFQFFPREEMSFLVNGQEVQPNGETHSGSFEYNGQAKRTVLKHGRVQYSVSSGSISEEHGFFEYIPEIDSCVLKSGKRIYKTDVVENGKLYVYDPTKKNSILKIGEQKYSDGLSLNGEFSYNSYRALHFLSNGVCIFPNKDIHKGSFDYNEEINRPELTNGSKQTKQGIEDGEFEYFPDLGKYFLTFGKKEVGLVSGDGVCDSQLVEDGEFDWSDELSSVGLKEGTREISGVIKEIIEFGSTQEYTHLIDII